MSTKPTKSIQNADQNTKINKVTSDDVVEITGDLLESVSGGMSKTNRDSPPDGAAFDGGGGDFGGGGGGDF
jgi:uncharacterized membrane protein YgcG